MSRERETEVPERARGTGDGGASGHGGWRAERAARLCLFLVLGMAFDEERGERWERAPMTDSLGVKCARIRGWGEL
jgi:hypothetical protein